jgi:hypothetical protein
MSVRRLVLSANGGVLSAGVVNAWLFSKIQSTRKAYY